MMAPILVMSSTPLLPWRWLMRSRSFSCLDSGCSIRSMADAMRAPCWTKSVESFHSDCSRPMDSLHPDPAPEIPSAIAAPYLTCGL